MSGVKVPYTRKPHSKVRTGCKTCKIRHKKCDELRPACRRCTDTGRTCDGYASTVTETKTTAVGDATFSSSSAEAFAVSIAPTNRRVSNTNEHPVRSLGFSALGTGVTEIEYRCFSHFCHRTSPLFASYFELSVWRSYIICGALSHPALFSTAVALGAVHRRFAFGISREAFEYCAHASRLHQKALNAVQQLKMQTKTQGLGKLEQTGSNQTYTCDEWAVIVLCEFLLGSFQVFQGEYDRSKLHFEDAMKYLIRRPLTLEHSESLFCVSERKPRVFCQLFYQLHGCAVELFGSPTQIIVRWEKGVYLPQIPSTFNTLEEARDFLFTEYDWVMHAPARFSHKLHERSAAADMHITRLQNWSLAYISMMRDVQRTPQQERICLLLKTIRDAIYVAIHAELFVDVNMGLPKLPQLNCDVKANQFNDLLYVSTVFSEVIEQRKTLSTVGLARLKELIEPCLNGTGLFDFQAANRNDFDYSYELFYAQPQDFKKTYGKISTKPAGGPNLGDDPNNCWEMLGVYGVAQRVSEIEENATVQAVRSVIDDRIDLKWVDLVPALERGEVMVRYYRPNESGFGLSLIQEWWRF